MYQPRSIREILTEMKNLSDLMVDLSYASILLQSVELAERVHDLESRMDDLMFQIRTIAAVLTRNVQEARMITAILHVANAAEHISNATGDIADLVRKGERIPQVVRDAFRASDEKIAMVKVGDLSTLKDRKLMELKLASSIGVLVLAIKREREWILPVNRETSVLAGDLLVVKGPPDGIEILRAMAGERGKTWKSRGGMAAIRRCLAEMRDLSSLVVDLAYSSIFLRSVEIAREVKEIHEKFEKLSRRLWLCVLRTARVEKDISGLYTLLKIAMAIQQMVDSAGFISEVVMRGVELHPVFDEALSEADELVGHASVAESSEFAGKTLKELSLWTRMGAYVLMVKRGDRYIFDPPRKLRIRPGDSLILRGTRRGVDAVKKAAEASG
ncbi:MAG: TrkA C-terminal domain-containing protein [Candidatus Hadarchaeales archaeon]